MELTQNSVTYKGKKYFVKKEGDLITLDLLNKKIKDMNQIEGLERLIDLQSLNLAYNNVKEIKHLESLKNLIKLDLSRNQISEVKGLETLTNLEELHLDFNQIEVIKGFDNLVNLRYLDLYMNNIYRVESLKNINNLSTFILKSNPIDYKMQFIKGDSPFQKLVQYAQMSDEEINLLSKAEREWLKIRKNVRKGKIRGNLYFKDDPIRTFGIGFLILGLILVIIGLFFVFTRLGISLIIIGVILIFISLSILTKGVCCTAC